MIQRAIAALSRSAPGRLCLSLCSFVLTLGGVAGAQSAFGYSVDDPTHLSIAMAVVAAMQAAKEPKRTGPNEPQTRAGYIRARALDALGAAITLYIVAAALHKFGWLHPVWLALSVGVIGYAPASAFEALFVKLFTRAEGAVIKKVDEKIGPPDGGQP